MKKILFILVSILIGVNTLMALEIVSPDNQIKLVVELRNRTSESDQVSLFYKVMYRMDEDQYFEVIPFSKLGIIREDQKFTGDLKLINQSKPTLVQEKYTMIHGKRMDCENEGTECIMHLENANGKLLDIIFRAYNDGIAFRYSFPEKSDRKYRIVEELTSFVIPDGTRRWMQSYHHAYEDYYFLNTDGSSNKANQEWGFPALFQVKGKQVYALITESNISRNNCGTHLSNSQNPEVYKIMMPSIPKNKILLEELPEEYNMSGAYSTLPWQSQWRVMIIGPLSTIVESTLVNDLAESTDYQNISWIEPGVSSWDWWYNNSSPRNYEVILDYIDLAAEMDWPYMLVDAGWEEMENGGDIKDVIRYAKSKGVKILVWYESSTFVRRTYPPAKLNKAEDREKEFSWLHEMGVSGIKVDFFVSDQQDIMNYYIHILEDAAKYKLVVNFHGSTLPRGWERTYPNLMTCEAVFGAEMYGFKETMSTQAHSHNTILPFTRNVVGSMDYTPVTFSHLKYFRPTSYAHELALSVVFESGIQHFADNPEVYRSLPEEQENFLKGMPVAWDETRLIDGNPGEKVVIARKKGDDWYIGGISGLNNPVTHELTFDFLKSGSYTLSLIQDGSDNKDFYTKTFRVKKDDSIYVPCLPGGGYAGLIKKL